MKASENKKTGGANGLNKRVDKKSVGIRWNSARYFQIGLILSLLAVIAIMEIKVGFTTVPENLGKEYILIENASYDFVIEKQVAAVIPEKKVTPRVIQKKTATTVIEVKPDDAVDVIETPTAPSDIEPAIVDKMPSKPVVPTKEPAKELDLINVQFVPVYPGCEYLTTNKEKVACMSSKINDFIGRKFRTSDFDYLDQGSLQKIYVQFKINSEGYITDIKARAPDKLLKQEAERVIAQLPTMKPGRQGDVNVDVRYVVPINFKVEN